MANEVYTRTNQALFFTRRALDAWAEAESSDALDALSLVQYHREHALFHLYRGVLAVVHVIAGRWLSCARLRQRCCLRWWHAFRDRNCRS